MSAEKERERSRSGIPSKQVVCVCDCCQKRFVSTELFTAEKPASHTHCNEQARPAPLEFPLLVLLFASFLLSILRLSIFVPFLPHSASIFCFFLPLTSFHI